MTNILTKSKLQQFKSPEIWEEFYTISQIPRASFHEEKIVAYIESVAKTLNYIYKKDSYKNIVVTIPASQGYENAPTILLQSHTDMVTTKTPEKKHDFNKDPITLIQDGDWVHADGTTLGADDGIGVAYMLALMKNPTCTQHGTITCLFTAAEEQDPQVNHLDTHLLKDCNYYINLDMGDENTCCVGSASATLYTGTLNYQRKDVPNSQNIDIIIEGLKGGHSGEQIATGRFSAVHMLIRFLTLLKNDTSQELLNFCLIDFNAKNPDNVIARQSLCTIAIHKDDMDLFQKKFQTLKQQILVDNQNFSDFHSIQIYWKESQNNTPPIEKDTGNNILNFLLLLPYGVQDLSIMSEFMNTTPPLQANLSDTSCNIANISLSNKTGFVRAFFRTNSISNGNIVEQKLKILSNLFHIPYTISEEIPVWTFKGMSPFVKNAMNVFNKHGIKPSLSTIHGGLEVSIILNKFKELGKSIEAISIGPTHIDLHSPQERLLIPSVSLLWGIILDLIHKVSTIP